MFVIDDKVGNVRPPSPVFLAITYYKRILIVHKLKWKIRVQTMSYGKPPKPSPPNPRPPKPNLPKPNLPLIKASEL